MITNEVFYFALGIFICMILDVFFAIANYLLQKSYKLRSERKNKNG